MHLPTSHDVHGKCADIAVCVGCGCGHNIATFVHVQQVRGRRGEGRNITHSSQLVSWADAVDADVATSSATAAHAEVV
jgi:hypothetical protein